MRLIMAGIYIVIMLYMLIRGYFYAFIAMLLFGAGFIALIPTIKNHEIRVAKKKIMDTWQLKAEGKTITPFIEVNSVPWYILAELPGISKEQAIHAIKLKKANGRFPCMDVFLHLLGVKHVYVEHIKTVAYVKNPIEGKPVEYKEAQGVQEIQENQEAQESQDNQDNQE